MFAAGPGRRADTQVVPVLGHDRERVRQEGIRRPVVRWAGARATAEGWARWPASPPGRVRTRMGSRSARTITAGAVASGCDGRSMHAGHDERAANEDQQHRHQGGDQRQASGGSLAHPGAPRPFRLAAWPATVTSCIVRSSSQSGTAPSARRSSMALSSSSVRSGAVIPGPPALAAASASPRAAATSPSPRACACTPRSRRAAGPRGGASRPSPGRRGPAPRTHPRAGP